MKKTLGFLMIISGIIFGLWAGIWWAFIGGIVDVITAVRAPQLVGMDIGIGITKILFSGLIGWVSGIVLAFPGYAMLHDA